ncbi:8162_t:CDS:2, partial [Entrophospora sp. SA101]
LPEILDLFDSFEEVGEVFVSVVVDDGGLGILEGSIMGISEYTNDNDFEDSEEEEGDILDE